VSNLGVFHGGRPSPSWKPHGLGDFGMIGSSIFSFAIMAI
jgi:hypothetical protein